MGFEGIPHLQLLTLTVFLSAHASKKLYFFSPDKITINTKHWDTSAPLELDLWYSPGSELCFVLTSHHIVQEQLHPAEKTEIKALFSYRGHLIPLRLSQKVWSPCRVSTGKKKKSWLQKNPTQTHPKIKRDRCKDGRWDIHHWMEAGEGLRRVSILLGGVLKCFPKSLNYVGLDFCNINYLSSVMSKSGSAVKGRGAWVL